ncbi:hypothetical protein SO802_030911 [Lithocarpus litseifolius]|uniref:CCHC-type domain-containing protein n=1 Tax=Lithocarpus litseifolius TaxID=425828 RepID=A0AAW2BM67_9ROSI
MPVVSGFMLRLDNGTRTWVQCRYERVHKLCTKCGLIGHTSSQCSESMDEVERMLIRQRQSIQRLYQVPYAFDSLEPQFHNELRAYFNKRRRWTTRVRYGNMDVDNPSQDHPSHAIVDPEPPLAPDHTPNQSNSTTPTPQPSSLHQDITHASLHIAILYLSINRGPVMTNGVLREATGSSSVIESDSKTIVMFNLDRLNDDRPEWLRGNAWEQGQIPESTDGLINSLVNGEDRDRLPAIAGSVRHGPSFNFASGSAHYQSPIQNMHNLQATANLVQ